MLINFLLVVDTTCSHVTAVFNIVQVGNDQHFKISI
jgi:hypothetical protein